MRSLATVAGDARLRIFVGYPVPSGARETLVEWAREGLGAVGGVRLVRGDDLHLTVAFLGAIAADRVEPVAKALRDVANRQPRPRFATERFRTTRSVGMVVLRDLDSSGTRLAEAVQVRLATLGVYAPDARPWLPHVTVARWKERPARVRTYVPVMEIVPSEIVVYLSVLRDGGAQYEILDSAALGG